MAKTYFVGSNNQVKRIDNHTFQAPNGIQLTPVGSPDTIWRDVMTHPTNEDKVIIVGSSNDIGSGGANNTSIQISDDAGATWTTPGGNWDKLDFFHEVWWCEDGQTIWAINSNGKVVKSIDAGSTFNEETTLGVNFGGDTFWTSAIYALDENTAVVAGSPSGSIDELNCYVWITTDGGGNWTLLNGGASLFNNIINPSTGQPWTNTGASNGIWCSPTTDKIVVAAGYGQWLSTDGGISFQGIAVATYRSGQHLTWLPTYDINPPTYRHVGGGVISVVESLTAGLSWTYERVYSPGTIGIIPPTNQSTPIIGAHFYETEKGYYSANNQLFSTDDGAVTGTPIDSITNGIIQAVWTGETIPQEPTLYTLVDTCENEPFYNDAGIIVVFEYNQICDAGFCPIDLQSVIITSFDDDDLYNGAGCYLLTEITSYPTNAYVTRNYEDTFNQNGNITTVDTIEQCCPISPCYLLTDCAGNEDPIYTGTDLSAHVGQTITLADEDNHEIATCWQVSLSDQECFDVPAVVVYKCYDDCEDCLPAPTPIRKPTNRQVLPNYETGNCDPELVEKAFCAHSDMWHKIVRERRFMIKQCCPKDEDKINMEYYKIKSKLLESTDPTPDPCNPLCYEYEATVQPTFSAVTTFVDCFGTEQTIVTPIGTEPQVIVFCALNTTTPTITITDSNDNEIGTFPITPTEECVDPVVPFSCCIDIKIYNGPGYGEAILTTPSGAFGNGQPYWQFELINPAPPLGDGLPTGIFIELSQVNGIGNWRLYEIPVIPSVPNSGTGRFTAIQNPTIANCPSDLPISAWVAVTEEWNNAETSECNELACCGGEAIFRFNPITFPPISDTNFEVSFQIFVPKGTYNGREYYTALIEGALEVTLWYDGINTWYITESPLGDIGNILATLDTQACPYGLIPPGLPAWNPVNPDLRFMYTKECTLNYDINSGDFLVQYVDDPFQVVVLNKNNPNGTYNGQKYWQFEFFEIFQVGNQFDYIPSGRLFEISFDVTWKMYEIASIGQPAGTGTLAFTTNNSTSVDPSAIVSVERDPNGWATVGGIYINDYVITSDG